MISEILKRPLEVANTGDSSSQRRNILTYIRDSFCSDASIKDSSHSDASVLTYAEIALPSNAIS